VSDITKKIFSIEQADDINSSLEPSTSDVIRPLMDEGRGRKKNDTPEKVPEFVTRESVRPRATPPSEDVQFSEPSKAGGWIILGFGLIYIIAVGLWFGPSATKESLKPLSVAGLVLLLTLPAILLFLLWRALRHLSSVSQQNTRLSKAADLLVSPDREALSRTESLAEGIRTQISKVNSGLSDTVEVLKGVQLAVARESQSLDAAGLALSKRSDDVGQNLTLQRQALESLSGTFDTRMSTLSTEITEKGSALDQICRAAETKILSAGKAMGKASATVQETAKSSADLIAEKTSQLEDTNQKLAETADILTSSLSGSTDTLLTAEGSLTKNSEDLQTLNAQTQSQISELQATIGHGYEMLAELKSSTEGNTEMVASYYKGLSNQLKRAEDDSLAAQGQTARMVESSLAQMRRDFSRMETDLQSLQVKLNRLRDTSENLEQPDLKPARLNLTPLDSDFPPVEPPRHVQSDKSTATFDAPLNLGTDMEIESPDDPLINFEPDVIRRPGDTGPKPKNRGFGRRNEKDEKSGWRWRDMLGTLERPGPDEGLANATSAAQSVEVAKPEEKVDGVGLLTALQLSPAAIVDEGTVVDATQARINNGEPGLTSVVAQNLPEAVSHLKENLATDPALRANLQAFTVDFSKMIGNTPPTAPALRAALGSPDGRAYLLCAAAFKPELRA